MKPQLNNIEKELLMEIPDPQPKPKDGTSGSDFAAINFTGMQEIREKYGREKFWNALNELEKKRMIYWEKFNPGTTVIRKTKSLR